MRKYLIISIVFAAIISLVTTMLQIQPALFIIEMMADHEGKFSVTIALALTFLLFLIPLVLISFLSSLMKTMGNKNENFETTLEGSGIIVERTRALYGAAFALDILVDGEKKASIMLGKKVAISLTQGIHKVQVLALKNPSPTLEIDIQVGQAIDLVCGFEKGGTMKDVFIKEKK